MTDPDWLAERFESHRAHLRGVAYRMLGSLAEAEDTVQDAWLRASRADAPRVENLGGWLTTIVARLCLDRLRARASRREEPGGLEIPDPIVEAPEVSGRAADPERQAVVAESIGLAMLIVLDQLTPAERLAFVLHDTFGFSFEEIAPIVERSPTATRKLASRARQRVRGAVRPPDASPARQRELANAFFAAAGAGDFEALLRVLDPDVIVRADASEEGGLFGGSSELRGADVVARTALRFSALAPGARAATVNATPGFVVFTPRDRPFAVIAFSIRGDRIAEIDFVLRPDRLARLDLSSVTPKP